MCGFENSLWVLCQEETGGASLVVQRLRLCASTAGGMGSIPDWGTKIPHASQHGQKINKNKNWCKKKKSVMNKKIKIEKNKKE